MHTHVCISCPHAYITDFYGTIKKDEVDICILRRSPGVPWWLSELCIWSCWSCPCCSLGHCCGTGSIPGPETSACLGCSQKKKKRKENFQVNKNQWSVLKCGSSFFLPVCLQSQEVSFDYSFSSSENPIRWMFKLVHLHLSFFPQDPIPYFFCLFFQFYWDMTDLQYHVRCTACRVDLYIMKWVSQ